MAQSEVIDFFTVPTATFRVLYCFVVLCHERRRVVHFNITAHPTAEWATWQITEAFPFDDAPRYLLRDRDGIYGQWFRDSVKHLGIEEDISAPRSPWQNPYVERLIGSVRRECLDHLIALGERHLRRILKSYCDYYNSHGRTWRCTELADASGSRTTFAGKGHRHSARRRTLALLRPGRLNQ